MADSKTWTRVKPQPVNAVGLECHVENVRELSGLIDNASGADELSLATLSMHMITSLFLSPLKCSHTHTHTRTRT